MTVKPKSFFFSLALLLFLFLGSNASMAQTIRYCDSLIKVGIEELFKRDHVKSIELLTEARSLAERNNWHKQSFQAIHHTGWNYYVMLDYGEALDYYLKGYEIAIKHLGAEEELLVLANIAIIYAKEKKYPKGEEYLTKAYDIAKKINDSTKVGYCAINLGSFYNETNELQRARKYLDEADRYLKHKPEVQVLVRIVQLDNDLLMGYTLKARTGALALIETVKKDKNNENLVHLYKMIGKTFKAEKNPVLALEWTKKALAAKPDKEVRMEIFELLSGIYFDLKYYKEALQYKDSVTAVTNELNEIKNIQLFKTGEVKFQIQNFQKEIAAKDAKILYERKFFYSILTLGVIIIVFLSITFWNMRIKNKQQKLIAERNQEIIQFKLQKEMDDNLLSKKKEEIAVLEQERLKKEIELKNQKISAEALYVSGRNQLLQEILESLASVPELSKNKVLIDHVKALQNHLKTDNDWDDFIRHFEEVNQGFLKKLKTMHPELTSNDIRFISYLCMNLTVKEISMMLNITYEACRKRKERISAKLGLTDDMSLNDYLASI